MTSLNLSEFGEVVVKFSEKNYPADVLVRTRTDQEAMKQAMNNTPLLLERSFSPSEPRVDVDTQLEEEQLERRAFFRRRLNRSTRPLNCGCYAVVEKW